jgi:ubiquinone/menaquinone biosynthesis C-methylase UbiE
MHEGTRGEQEQWQLDGSAPELYQRHLVLAVTAQWAADLVDRAALQPGERVLDVACGTGVVARLAAQRVGQTGWVAALDLNPGMLAVAWALPAVAGAKIDWWEGSALALPFPAATFDVVLCQLGLQFFPGRLTALQEMRRVLKDGGRMGLNVYGPIEHNPATFALANALDRHIGPDASLAKRTEHALADSAELRELIAAAGFQDVALSTVTKTIHFPSAAEYVRIQLAATPLATVLSNYDAANRSRLVEAMIREVSAELASYVEADGLAYPQEAHTVLAGR